MDITQESFEALLSWLDADDRGRAALRYNTIRAGLIRLFSANGLADAEHWADVTFDRVITRLPDIRQTYVGKPEYYIRAVARKVLLEVLGRRKEIATDSLPEISVPPAEADEMQECLRKCLKLLPPGKRELILDYHVYAKREKIENHKALARELGVTEAALRLQAHRLREGLRKCVLACAGRPAETNDAPIRITDRGGKNGRVK